MIDPFLFAKGAALGLAIAAPVGPIGILTIRRTLAYGQTYGIMTGIGAGLGDGVYGLVAAFGLVAVGEWLVSLKLWFHLLGGAAILIFGIHTLMTAGKKKKAEETIDSIGGATAALVSSFLLTLTNPMTILSFFTAFTAIGLTQALTPGNGIVLVGGVIAGSMAWFLTLTGIVAVTHHALSHNALLWIDRIAGILLLVFAAYLIASAFVPGLN
jgi:threonine/homoserine/homoserine lactone efflux protein